ncbi:MAG: M15 family metallopeptidase [Flavobacteriales bacterium]|nr:M15 family metallopeptidase [Flavobacteriales bacterium]
MIKSILKKLILRILNSKISIKKYLIGIPSILIFTIILLIGSYNYSPTVITKVVNNTFKFFGFINVLHLDTDDLEYLKEYKSENIVGAYGKQILIHKRFIRYIKRVDKCAIDNNLVISINSSYRHKGRIKYVRKVKPVRNSNHVAGFAIDFNPILNNEKYFSSNLSLKYLHKQPKEIKNFIKCIRDDKDLRWGGVFNDPIHIDFPLNKKYPKRWDKYKEQCYQDYEKAHKKWMFWK